MTREERFLADLAQGVVQAGGARQWEPEAAMQFAREVLVALRGTERQAYPHLVELDGLRFVYQWDQRPPLLTIMHWDDIMWRDMARLSVPPDVI